MLMSLRQHRDRRQQGFTKLLALEYRYRVNQVRWLTKRRGPGAFNDAYNDRQRLAVPVANAGRNDA